MKKVITESNELKKQLKRIKPGVVAVAYLGKGWLDYLGKKLPDKLIVSPTPGSNPKSIREAIKRIGIKNVYFLDELHAKIYLGKSEALVGSCNLSRNGFEENEEAAVLIDDKKGVETLQAVIANYTALARDAYPEDSDKREKLKWLDKHKLKPQKSLGRRRSNTKSSLEDYLKKPNKSIIHLSTFVVEDYKFNKQIINKKVPETQGVKDLASYFKHTFGLRESLAVKPGDWLLLCGANKDGTPRKAGRIYWMFAHYVISGGVSDKSDKSVTKLVATRKGKEPPFPFELTDSVKDGIRKQWPTKKQEDHDALFKNNKTVEFLSDVMGKLRRVRK